MPSAIEVAGDVAAAGGALAGLILVYLGAVSASFDRFDKVQQQFVVGAHRRRAWFGFAGLAFCLVSVALALLGKWLAAPCLATAALMILTLALVWVLIAAALTVLGIRWP
jgi:hypothetical protein